MAHWDQKPPVSFGCLLVWLALVTPCATDARHDRLERQILDLSAGVLRQRYGATPPQKPSPPRQQKVQHFVVLLMENHAADHMFGCMNLPGYDSVVPGHALPNDPNDPTKGTFNVTCDARPGYVCEKLANYDTFASKFGRGGNPYAYPYSPQHDNNSWKTAPAATKGEINM
eukprot:SAG31_NODE_10775_length_1099_cov_1.680000_1_plen_170_part_01